MKVEQFEWDESNLDHATRHGVSVSEIEQAIENARHARKGRTDGSDRVMVEAQTNGGRQLRVIVQVKPGGVFRPITAWEMKR